MFSMTILHVFLVLTYRRLQKIRVKFLGYWCYSSCFDSFFWCNSYWCLLLFLIISSTNRGVRVVLSSCKRDTYSSGKCSYEGIGCALAMQSIHLDNSEIPQGFRHWFGCDDSFIRFVASESRRLCFLRIFAGSVNPHEWGCAMRLSTRLSECFHIVIVVLSDATAYCHI